MERVGIDLVLGLPLTESGYNGILVITEYLSKYPYAVPIRSKSAKEISRHLWHYFCLFGPAKEILSDCGKEFLNEVISEMLTLTGTIRRHTSVYLPHCNGLTEKYNGTLCSALRKHAENDQLTWDLWLDGCLYSYRKSIQKSTKFAPFNLFFGRTVPDFENFTLEPNNVDASALIRRSAQIQEHQELVLPEAVENIKKAQVQQKIGQDSRNNILSNPLAKGTMVAIRIPGLLKKLDERYRGPYLIVKRTPTQNYIIKNKMGKHLSKSFPLSKLKIIKDWASFDLTAEDEIGNNDCQVIDRILNERSRNGVTEYLIKWHGYTCDYNSWLTEKDIVDKKKLSSYRAKWISDKSSNLGKSSITCVNFVNIGKRIKPRVNTKFSYLLSFIKFIVFFWLITMVESSILLNDSFKYCTTNSANLQIDFSSDCIFSSNHFSDQKHQYAVFEKNDYTLDGWGYRCNIVKQTYQTFETFWGIDRDFPTENMDVPMTYQDCLAMVSSKKCFDTEMKCSDENCISESTPILTYMWELYQVFVVHNCYSSKVRLLSSDSIVFSGASDSCKINDLFCTVGKYHFIWSADIIVQCPLYLIGTDLFSSMSNFLFSKLLFFQTTNVSMRCGNTSMLSTTEGLYLLRFNNKSELSNFRVNTDNNDQARSLIVSDLDRKIFILLNMMETINMSMNKKICIILASTIDVHKKRFDEFFSIKDQKLNDLIIYNKFGTLVIATCKNVSNVQVVDDDICYTHFKVSFQLQEGIFYGFLTHDGVIRRDSNSVHCSSPLSIELPNGSILLRKNGKAYHYVNTNIKFNFYNTIDVPTNLFIHEKQEFSHLNSHNHLSILEDISTRLSVVPEQYKPSNYGTNFFMTTIHGMGSIFSSIWKKMSDWFSKLRIILYLFGSIIALALIVYILRICYRWFPKKTAQRESVPRSSRFRAYWSKKEPNLVEVITSEQLVLPSASPFPVRRRFSVISPSIDI